MVEETFHTFAYSPVYDDDSRVSGMLCVVVEDTKRAIGERRLRLLRQLAAVPTQDATSLAQVGERIVEVLASSREDTPIGELYLVDAGSHAAHRVIARHGAEPSCLPAQVALDDPAAGGPIAAVAADGEVRWIADVPTRLGRVPGPWGDPVRDAVVAPLAAAASGRALGAVLLGASPRSPLDETYRSFLMLAASQVASRLAETQAQIEQREKVEAMAELDRAKNLFFSNVSHEFRTPLTLMLGPVDTLRTRGDLPADVLEDLQLVHRNGVRLRKLVNSLLDFSRIEAGRLEATYQPTDLAALTQDLASVFRSAVEQAGLRFEVQCEPLGTDVHVDRDMWEKIVLNLLSNAFKFTFDVGIRVTLAAESGAAVLRVRDTGIGMDAQALSQVFDRFHRVAGARSRSHEGTGIGLAFVSELVKLHGGTVRADSAPGQGTCFTVSLPIGAAHLPAHRLAAAGPVAPRPVDLGEAFVDDVLRAGDAMAEPARERAPDAAATRDPQGAHLLIVDDNADMRAYIAHLLEAQWSVQTAGDGQQALAAIRERRPDLIVSDVMMPVVDSYALLRELRDDPETRTLPVILLSAQAGEEARLAGLHRGADDDLVKPFSARELVARVEVLLMRQRMRAAQEGLNKRLADVFRHSPVGVALVRGPQHVYEFCNAEYQRLVGGRARVGIALRDTMPELDGQGVIELLDGVRETGTAYVGRAFAVDLLEPDSGERRQRYFDFVHQPIDHGDGEAGIAIVCFEVSELMRARHQAEAASRAKDEFMAILGHELRNPLAPIQTALHLMRMKWSDTAPRERAIIERQVQHMVRLVDDLLDVARITRGRIELRKTVVELATVVDKAIEMASPALESKRQPFSVDVPAHGLGVLADPTRLSQVVSNLLVNAAKFTDAGGAVRLQAGVDGADRGRRRRRGAARERRRHRHGCSRAGSGVRPLRAG